MAYANAQNPQRRAAVLGTVVAVHALIGYALVTGLGAKFIPQLPTVIIGTNQPLPKPEPTPDPAKPAAKNQRDTPQKDNPYVPPIDDPIVPAGGPGLASGGGEAIGGGDGGIGEVVFPPPPPPPAFTPRKPRPRNAEAGWVTTNDYPSNDIRQEHEGTTRVRLTVGLNGRVTRCEVTASSGWPGLDTAACARMSSRARFDPASDQTGATVEGSYATAVKWQIPEE